MEHQSTGSAATAIVPTTSAAPGNYEYITCKLCTTFKFNSF
jgi:hypothetical protein